MKWIVIVLFLVVAAAVVTGRLSASWLIYCFAALFAAMAAALVFAFVRSKHYGLLLLAFTYFGSALAAVAMFQWWPLIMGFGFAWVLRMMGVEPAAEEMPTAANEPAADDEKKPDSPRQT